jgi:hypothetical protein
VDWHAFTGTRQRCSGVSDYGFAVQESGKDEHADGFAGDERHSFRP